MIAPEIPANDDVRVRALHRLGLLDSENEERFDRLTRMTSRMFDVPISYISLVDENRQWLKSCVGMDVRETARDISFCGHAILANEILIVPDAQLDPRFQDNPMVIGPPHIRFYAGIPLATEDNHLVGTLCLADKSPRNLDQVEQKLLSDVAILVRDEMNFRGSRQLAAIINSSDDAIISKTLKGIITTWNRGAEKVFGYSAEEMIGKPMLLLFPPERAAEEERILERIGHGENVEHFETVRVRKDGKRINISVTLSPITDDEGKVIGASKIARDITGRKQAEERILEQAALLDKTQDAIVLVDMEGRGLFWNKGAVRMYGWTQEEIMGRKVGDFTQDDPDKFPKIYRQLELVGDMTYESIHHAKDGRKLAVEVRVTLIRNDEGQPKSVLGVITDITEKKKIEAQFMRAQRMESIGTLAGGVAHDLNNILAPIMMSIDVLKSLSADPQMKIILETIEVSAKRGADIVRQVLSFARGMQGERVEIQPKHLLKDLESIIKDTFPKDIRLHFAVPNDTWTILGDPTQIHQILLNLCVNARDAMPHGGNLSVTVQNCELDDQYVAMNIQAKVGRYVEISVTDSGTGIPAALLDKIFEPFFTTKELSKGTGLGLSTVSAIVKSHGGIINVYSEQGKGSTFKVYLPAMETSSASREGRLDPVSLPRGNGETVLVVDDEASILTITSQTLQAFGYKVLTATDGADALAIYAQHQKEIAVVLTDMMMPVLDGPATIYALMRINPTVKIVAASGLNANGGVAKVSGVGVKHFLTKPYTAGTLLKSIRTILDEV